MRYALVLTIALAAVLVAACSSQSPAADTPAANPPSGEAANDAPQQQAADTPVAAEAQKKDATESLAKILDAKSNVQFKIAYDVKAFAMGTTMTSQMTMYMKTEKKVRTDVSTQGIEARSYILGDVATTCTKMNNDWTCYKVQFNTSTDVEKQVRENKDAYTIVEDGTKTVAGVETTCYRMTPKDAASVKVRATSRVCYSKDYLPLYMLTETTQSNSELIATSVSKSVSDSDFVPPAAASDMPSIPSGMGGAGAQGGADPCASCAQLSGEAKEMCLQYC